jgi:ATP-binding cassette subfamily B protein
MDGAMDVGFLLAFLLYVQRFFDPVLELSMQYTELQRAMASGHRIFEIWIFPRASKINRTSVELPPVEGEIIFQRRPLCL